MLAIKGRFEIGEKKRERKDWHCIAKRKVFCAVQFFSEGRQFAAIVVHQPGRYPYTLYLA